MIGHFETFIIFCRFYIKIWYFYKVDSRINREILVCKSAEKADKEVGKLNICVYLYVLLLASFNFCEKRVVVMEV